MMSKLFGKNVVLLFASLISATAGASDFFKTQISDQYLVDLFQSSACIRKGESYFKEATQLQLDRVTRPRYFSTVLN